MGISSAMGPSALLPGVVLLSSGSFSAVTEVNIDSVFSSTYDQHLLKFDEDDSDTAGETRLQWRSSASNDSTANYCHQNSYFTTSTTSVRVTSGGSSSLVTQNVGASGWRWSMNIFDPSSSANTVFDVAGNVSTGSVPFLGGGAFLTTTSFTGVRIYRTAGTFTGSYAIFGFRK